LLGYATSYLVGIMIDDDDDAYMGEDLNMPDDYETGICDACNGSGEGQYDGSTCSTCKGRGEA